MPVIDYTVQDLADTQYDVSVVFGQYDFWGNPPDRPWDLLAAVNSLFGGSPLSRPDSTHVAVGRVELLLACPPLGRNDHHVHDPLTDPADVVAV